MDLLGCGIEREKLHETQTLEFLIFNKPYGVLSQFTDRQSDADGQPRRATLADYIDRPDHYPAGRLDYHSEGLMILTDSGALQDSITSPSNKMAKSYWVQIEGDIATEQLQALKNGIVLKDGKTRPATVKRIAEPKPDNAQLWSRYPPVTDHRERNSCWISMTISEGKNRQIRRMCAAIGHPVLRLIRFQIGPWGLNGLQPGQFTTQTVNLPHGKGHSSKHQKSRPTSRQNKSKLKP